MKKALVVDDSKLARMSVIKELQAVSQNGFTVFEAANGKEAVERFKNELPDVVFLDLTMPDMDGYEALGRIMIINPDANVAVISADVQSKSVEKVLELGAKMHISKPIDNEKMTQALDKLGANIG